MLRVCRHENVFIMFLMAIKTAGSAQKVRVGLVSGNKAIFYLRLWSCTVPFFFSRISQGALPYETSVMNLIYFKNTNFSTKMSWSSMSA